MFTIESEKALIDAFRPRDRRTLELPEGVKYPLFVRDYLAWVEPTGVRVFLAFNLPKGALTGIAFRRDQQGERSTSAMCEWCHWSGGGTSVGLLTAQASSKRRVGVNLCLDLTCSAKMEQIANLSGRNYVEMARQHHERILKFAHEGLGIDLSGAR